MLFALYCLDKPNSLDRRMQHRPAHLEYLKSFEQSIVMAGALLEDDGQTMKGSLIVVDFPSREEAEAFSAGDPFRKDGVFGSVSVTPFRKAIPRS